MKLCVCLNISDNDIRNRPGTVTLTDVYGGCAKGASRCSHKQTCNADIRAVQEDHNAQFTTAALHNTELETPPARVYTLIPADRSRTAPCNRPARVA